MYIFLPNLSCVVVVVAAVVRAGPGLGRLGPLVAGGGGRGAPRSLVGVGVGGRGAGASLWRINGPMGEALV